MAVLAVASLSARLLAEAAACDGHRVVALDLFGDADTRRAAVDWQSIGSAAAMRIDGSRLLDALTVLARRAGDDALGWIPGSGFEARPDLIAAGKDILPLLGTAAHEVRRVRDPALFFGVLAAHGIDHPPMQREAPADAAGWLSKDADGCGGWHIRPATSAPEAGAVASRYFQRRLPGMPMSATFIGNGHDAAVLGFNELVVRPVAGRPMVYCGCIGPVPLPPSAARRVVRAVEVVTAAFALRGWCSLDFLCEGDEIAVLEVNPRPPASLGVYGPRGLVDAQLNACLRGTLPTLAGLAPVRTGGTRTVFAAGPVRLDAVAAERLARAPGARDLPPPGASFEAGDPVCSLVAHGEGRDAVAAALEAGQTALLSTLAA